MTTLGPLGRRSQFDDLEYSDKQIRPLWSLPDLTDEKELEKWFEETVIACQDYYRDYFQVQQDNLLLYKGLQWLAADRNNNQYLGRAGNTQNRNPRVVINHLADFVTQWVSRLTRYRPAVAIYPARAQQADADDARIAKQVLDYIWYENRIDEVLQDWARHIKIFGEGYMMVTWNPNKGDTHPDYAATQVKGQVVPLLDSEGNPVLNEKGDPMSINKTVKIGDLEYKVRAPWHFFDMPCRDRDKIEWSIVWDVVDVDYLKAKYPDKADEIHPDLDINNMYTGYRTEVGKFKNQCVVYELFHDGVEFMEEGRYIKRIKNVILENGPNPYEHKKRPYLYMADMEVPDQIRGYSMFQQLFPLQHQVNACASLIYKSLVLFAHPKFVIQDGSVEMQQLLNESTVVSFTGNISPTLLAQNPVQEALFKWEEYLVGVMEKLSGVFTMSRGQAPSGVRAAKALRVLEEQEDKRAYITAIKYNNIGLVENARMSLSVAGTYYDDSDGRLIQVVGQDNEWEVKKFTTANLTKPFHFRIENTTALSQSPAARIDEITELNQMILTPDSLIPRGQAVQLLDLTASDQFKSIETRAAKCAESENNDFSAGRPVQPPTPLEDLITHWKIHAQLFQSRQYKELMPPEMKAQAEQHFMVTEYLMWEKAYGIMSQTGMPMRMPNMVFQQKLSMMCPDFPMVLKSPTPPMGMMGMGGGMGGPMGTNTGIGEAPIDNGAGLDTGAPTSPPGMPPQPSSNPRM